MFLSTIANISSFLSHSCHYKLCSAKLKECSFAMNGSFVRSEPKKAGKNGNIDTLTTLIIHCFRTDIVETKKGFVQGRSITLLGGEFQLNPVDVFLGIPYALPPVGPRRYTVLPL